MIQISKLLTGYYVIAYSAVLKTVDKFVRMREITWSVKGALNVLLQSFCRRRYTVLNFKS